VWNALARVYNTVYGKLDSDPAMYGNAKRVQK
jgi:hypothetical protein